MCTRRFTQTALCLSASVRLGLILLLVMMWNVSPAPVAHAGTIAVNSMADNTTAGDDNCTLREAINNANSDSDTTGGDCAAGSGNDIITLPAGTYTLELAGAGEDANATGDLDITNNLTINGAGASTTTIDGDELDRVLHVHYYFTVEINGVTITNGRTLDGAPGGPGEDGGHGGSGGGIYNEGALTLNGSVVSGNATGGGGNGGDGGDVSDGGNGGSGGGIYNRGTLTLNNSTVSDNTTGDGGDGGYDPTGAQGKGGHGGAGGGILNSGSGFGATLNASTIISNTTGAAGAGSGYGYGGNGGGIYNGGRLTLNNSTVSSNTTGAGDFGGDGGGIYDLSGGPVTLDATTVTSNTATNGNGGGISTLNLGTVMLNDSTFRGNHVGSHGGGIYVSNSTVGTLILDACTVSGNTAASSGGGISSFNSTLTLNNSTVSGNATDGFGGGIQHLVSATGTLTVSHSTIAGNTADYDGDGNGDGGGIHQSGAGAIIVRNAIIAANIDTGGQAPDCGGNLTSQDYNLVGNNTGCTFTAQSNDQVGTGVSPIDPLLDSLADNGGPTWTHALQSGSPAIEQIPDGTNDCQAGVSTDQRGAVRADGVSRGGSACEIGAYEFDSTPITNFIYLPLVLKHY